MLEKSFDNSNYELERLLPKGKNKKVSGLMADELGWKIKKEFVDLKAKIQSKRYKKMFHKKKT